MGALFPQMPGGLVPAASAFQDSEIKMIQMTLPVGELSSRINSDSETTIQKLLHRNYDSETTKKNTGSEVEQVGAWGVGGRWVGGGWDSDVQLLIASKAGNHINHAGPQTCQTFQLV